MKPSKTYTSSRAVIAMILLAIETSMNSGWANEVGMYFTSDQATETYAWIGDAPAMREWVGARNAKGFTENNISITNKKFEATVGIPVDDLRRDKTGQLRVRVGQLTERAGAPHWEKLVTDLLTGNGTCYDGQAFFSATHSEGLSGTYSNLLTTSDYSELGAVTTPANPTPYEFAQAVLKVIQHMFTFKDGAGEPMNQGAKAFTVLVPVNLMGAAANALTKQTLDTGSGSVDNPLLGMGFQIRVRVNARLTNTTEFYVFRTDSAAKAIILQEEEGVTVSAEAEGSGEEFKNDRHLYGVKALRNVGFGYPQLAVKATLS